MIRRLRRWLFELAVSIDQFAHVLLGGPKFILRGGPVPCADETVSSKVGRMAIRGKRWALIAEAVLDRLFMLLGDAPGHCRRSIEEVCR